MKNSRWLVDINKVRTDYPVIENLSQYLVEDVPLLHPDHPNYAKFWSKETKKCIEGVWGREWGKYRYMPGNLYYFGNYTILKHTWEEGGVKVTKAIKPKIVDYFWEFAAISWTCYGFSGFEYDDIYSCNLKLKQHIDGELNIKYVPSTCFYNGKLKKYIPSFEYLLKLHDRPLGKCLFQNEAHDGMTMGTRRGGKSFWVSNGEVEYNFVFSGARRYDRGVLNQEYSCTQVIGSADTDKSSDLLAKFKESQDAKIDASNEDFKRWFGIWEERGYDERNREIVIVTPCPFYKRASGNLDCPNKKNPYSSRYKIELNGEWKLKGEGNQVFHVNYSSKKGAGAQAAVGNSYLFSGVEETGLVDNAVEIHTSNDSATKRGAKFGVQYFYGTSGNIEYVQASKKMFLNPQDYGMLGFRNVFSTQGKDSLTGYFLPKYMILLDFKDENGNTDYEAAIHHVNYGQKGRAAAAQSDDPRILRDHLMNEPCYVEEMWLTDKGYYLPYEEAAERERELLNLQLYKDLATPVELYWDEKRKRGVHYKIRYDVEPIVDWPLPKDLKDPSGSVVIFEWPQEIEGKIPDDLYSFVGYDPYVEEDIDRGGSLGVTYILKNPKYIPQGMSGNIIVASYIGKPIKGLEHYHEQQEKLLALYGNPNMGLWFEKNRGEGCREYYIRRNKLFLLAPSPDRMQGSNIYQRHLTSFGYTVGNHIAKKNLLRMVKDWLLEETEMTENGEMTKKKNIYRIPCLFLIRQIMQYDPDPKLNFDAVSGFVGCILGLREYENVQTELLFSRNEVNLFDNLLNNQNIFSKDIIDRRQQKSRFNINN